GRTELISCHSMSTERQQPEATIVGLEAQRALLGDAVVNAALAPLRAKLASLAPAPTDESPAQTLKQVTILFADIVGSTMLSQHLDPEATSAVIDGALARFAAIIERHGGTDTTALPCAWACTLVARCSVAGSMPRKASEGRLSTSRHAWSR